MPDVSEDLMAITPATTQRLLQAWQDIQSAGHGDKQPILNAACSELGINAATFYRHIDKIAPKAPRKRRCDAGVVALTRNEALVISALLHSSLRKNSKRLLSITQAMEILRANGEVRAEFTDPASGEIRPLSDSAIANALRVYNLHPDQLSQPAPAVEMRSLHPNHVWQIDASLCVLYYLNARTKAESGLQVMERERFYKNKPANLKRIEADRVWSYEWTDHDSGAIGLRYVLGAESAANITDTFIWAIQYREGQPFHGVPFILGMDMGSANTSGLLMNLLRRLGVKPIPHAPHNARATGQVEKARDTIERSFESSLRLRPVASLEELNVQAERWMRWFNANKIHSRHGQTRYERWMTIEAQQLRLAPSPEQCRALLTHTPQERKVSVTLTVSLDGREFDVRSVPDVLVGQRLMVATNPYQEDAAFIVRHDTDGNEVLQAVPLVARNEAGFREDANVIGEDWHRHAVTVADANRKEVERAIMDAPTDVEAAEKRKRKAVPFSGRIDPYKPMEQAPERTWMPRQGEALNVTTIAPTLVADTLDAVEAMRRLSRAIGRNLTGDEYTFMTARYGEGVPEDQIDALIAQFSAPPEQPLRAAGGLRAV